MKTIIAGSRDLPDSELLIALEECPFTPHITEVVSGTARGIDKAGEAWATSNAKQIKQFPANWARYRGGAGKIRNTEMAEYAEALIAVWDGTSPGTKHMISTAINKKLKVYVWDASKQEGYLERT